MGNAHKAQQPQTVVDLTLVVVQVMVAATRQVGMVVAQYDKNVQILMQLVNIILAVKEIQDVMMHQVHVIYAVVLVHVRIKHLLRIYGTSVLLQVVLIQEIVLEQVILVV